MAMSVLRVVLADDHELIRQGVASVLALIPETDVVAECDDLPSLLDAVATHRPDVVVTDIRMPPTNTNEGIVAARSLRAEYPDIGVVVLSQFAEPEYVLDLFEDGSDRLGYLLKDKVNVAEMERAVRSVATGGSAVDGSIIEMLVSSRRKTLTAIDRLTPREAEVLSYIAEGLNNSAVAAKLTLSHKAVAKHINSIFSKLDLGAEASSHSRVKAVLMWLSG